MIGWLSGTRRKIPFVQQLGPADCGVACLAMVARYHGLQVSQEQLADRLGIAREGASVSGLATLARELGLHATGVRVELDDLSVLPAGAILHWQFCHYVVLERSGRAYVDILDPGSGRRRVSYAECHRCFTGVALVVEATGEVATLPSEGKHRRVSHLRPILGELRDLAATLGASLLIQLFALVVPFVVGSLVDHVLPRRDATTLPMLVAIGAFAVVVSSLAQLIRGFASANLRARLSLVFGRRFVSHLLALPFAFFERRRSGDLIERIRSNSAIRDTVSGAAVSAVLDGLFVLLYFSLLFAASPAMAAAAVGLATLEASIYLASWRSRRELIASKLREAATTNAVEVETFGAIESLKGLGLERKALERWAATYRNEVSATLALTRVDALVSAGRAVVGLAAPLVLLGAGAQQVLSGALSIGTMLALDALALSVLNPLSGLFSAANQLQTVGGHLERIDDVLARPRERSGASAVPDGAREIRLERVSFGHGKGGPPAVDDVSLTIPAGAALALVGRSGAGKTTLARVIAGLYEPQSGSIHDAGVERRELDAQAVRGSIGYVPQEATLFGPTIRAELCLARPDATMADIVAVTRELGIHDEIMRMTLEYATPVIDGSVGLSGGQRQRIALARALIRAPGLLVLDEATSALDAHAESVVYACLARLQCTRVIVAHRLSTIRNADLVVVLDRGKVVEVGHPSVLEAAGGAYAGLVAGQALHRGITDIESVPQAARG